MNIRNYQPGDDVAQLAVYQAAAGSLPNFKPVTLGEVQRRTRARDFDPASRFYVEDKGQIIAYANYTTSGRVSYPWCLPGHEAVQQPLFEAVMQAMKQKQMNRASAAYRKDWPSIHDFFLRHGFVWVREMVNFVIDLVDMPTPAALPSTAISPLTREDLPTVLALGEGVLRVQNVGELEQHLFRNPYFTPDSLFVLRSRTDKSPVAVGILLSDPTFADAKTVDASMPCYRHGAFGTEGMNTKRIKGLFSFIARQEGNLNALGLDLMGYASYRLRDSDDIESLAGQVPSDVPLMLRFYERNFRRQGSFPVFERDLNS